METHIKGLELLSKISPAIYTSYLLSMFYKITDFLPKTMDNLGAAPVNWLEKIVSPLESIKSRWEDTVYDRGNWEWKIATAAVNVMIKSPVSQVKLTGVKILDRLC